MESSGDPKEGRDNAPFVAFGIIIGTVAWVFTQNVLWLGIGLVLGIVVGAAFQANRR